VGGWLDRYAGLSPPPLSDAHVPYTTPPYIYLTLTPSSKNSYFTARFGGREQSDYPGALNPEGELIVARVSCWPGKEGGSENNRNPG
jgi:hypothetical protein